MAAVQHSSSSSRSSDTPVIRIVVPTDVRRFFVDAVITGQGGYQSLCRMLAERLQTSAVLKLDRTEFVRVLHYATDYGDGGFQSRLRKMVVAWMSQNKDLILG